MAKINKRNKITSLFGSVVIILATTFFLSRILSKPAEAAWFDDTWGYRVRITVNNSGAAVTNQKIKLDIATDALVTAGKIQSDCGDSRFTTQGGEVLSYYLDTSGGACNTISTDYYVLLPNILAGATIIYHYYGNPGSANGTVGAQFAEATFSPASTASATEEKSTAPIAYWKFDEGSDNKCVGGTNDVCNFGSGGSTLDGAGSGFSSPITATSGWTSSGKFDKGLNFDGSDDRISFGTTGISATSGTISAWVNPSSTPATTQIIMMASRDSNRIYLYRAATTGNFGLSLGSTTNIEPGVVIPTSTWSHVAITWNSGTYYAFLNGRVIGSGSYSNLSGIGTCASIGSYDDCSSVRNSFFVGTIDEVKVYNFALSTVEIKNSYNRDSAQVFGVENTGQNLTGGAGSSPVADWKMDEKAGQLASDTTGNANSGTLGVDSSAGTDDPSWQPSASCKSGSCLKFDGANDLVKVGPSGILGFSSTGAFTISSWIKTTSSGGDIASNSWISTGFNNGWVFYLSGGALRFYASTYAANTQFDFHTGTITVNDGKWHHVLMTYNNKVVTFYVDGKRDNSDTLTIGTATLDTSSYGIILGAQFDTNNTNYTGHFNGQIDNSLIYSYARTNEQISFNYSQGEPVAYWKFDEGADNTCLDGNDVCNLGSLGNTAGTILFAGGANAPGWSSAGKFSKAIDNNRSQGDFSVSSDASWNQFGTGDFSASVWVYPRTTSYGASAAGTIISKNYTGFEMTIYQSQFIVYLGGASNGCGSAAILSPNNWYHLTLTRVGTQITEYINGKVACRNTNSTDVSNVGTALYIGARPGDAQSYLDGLIDEMKIYNFGLSADEVKLDYNRGSAIALGVEDTGQNLTGGAGNSSVGEWGLNEKTGSNAMDTSGNSHTGTITGADWKTAASCKIGSCLLFNSTDRVDTYDAGFTTTFSGSAFIKPTAVNTTYAIMGERGGSAGWAFYVRATGELGFTVSGVADYNSSGAGLVADQWQHVAFTVSGTAVRIYLNGRLVHSPTTASNVTSDATHLFIGNDGSSNYFSGLIDEVKVYNYARTPAQVAQDYNGGVPVAWWKFDECQGATAYNSAPNGSAFNTQDGTLTPVSSGNTTVGSCNSGTSTEMWNDGTTGKFNSSVGLDGTDDYVTVTDHNNLDQASSASIAAWVYVNTLKNYNQIFTKGADGAENYEAYITSTGSIGGEWTFNTGRANCSNSGNTNLTAGAWYHFVVTYESGVGCKNYINGTLVWSAPKTATSLTTYSTPLIIGADTSAAGRYFDGRIDDVRIYNYPLSANQVKQVMNGDAAIRFSE